MKKCDSVYCMPTCWYVEDAECPGSDESTHHCIDCDGVCWDEKGATCSGCENYWCTDYQNTFYYSVCTHLGDRYEADEEECSIAEAVENIQEGLCTQCVLKSNLKCTVEDCKFNYKNLLQTWVKFCERSLDVELASLSGHPEDVVIKAKLYRRRPNIEDLDDIWFINKDEVELYINGVKESETLSWKRTLDQAKRLIRQYEKEGFVLKSKAFALNEPHPRDKSPERK